MTVHRVTGTDYSVILSYHVDQETSVVQIPAGVHDGHRPVQVVSNSSVVTDCQH